MGATVPPLSSSCRTCVVNIAQKYMRNTPHAGLQQTFHATGIVNKGSVSSASFVWTSVPSRKQKFVNIRRSWSQSGSGSGGPTVIRLGSRLTCSTLSGALHPCSPRRVGTSVSFLIVRGADRSTCTL